MCSSDLNSLQGAFDATYKTDAPADCPGQGRSSGTWSKNNQPDVVMGQIACATYNTTEPQLMWTQQTNMVFTLVAGTPNGPTLDQLYTWWTSHS